jgi:hypothetical protein
MVAQVFPRFVLALVYLTLIALLALLLASSFAP